MSPREETVVYRFVKGGEGSKGERNAAKKTKIGGPLSSFALEKRKKQSLFSTNALTATTTVAEKKRRKKKTSSLGLGTKRGSKEFQEEGP